MKQLLKDALIAIGIMALWVALAYWHVNHSTVQAEEAMPVFRPKPPACVLRTNSYFDYDFSYQPPRLAGWYKQTYLECPAPGGVVVE